MSADPNYLFVSGVDLSTTRDFSAVVTLAIRADGRAGKIRLADHRLWKPPAGGKIPLQEIEQYILDLDEKLGLEFVTHDSYQCESTV